MEKVEPILEDCMEYFKKNPQSIPALESIVFYRLWQEEKAKNSKQVEYTGE